MNEKMKMKYCNKCMKKLGGWCFNYHVNIATFGVNEKNSDFDFELCFVHDQLTGEIND